MEDYEVFHPNCNMLQIGQIEKVQSPLYDIHLCTSGVGVSGLYEQLPSEPVPYEQRLPSGNGEVSKVYEKIHRTRIQNWML